jgi:hypothetical protein
MHIRRAMGSSFSFIVALAVVALFAAFARTGPGPGPSAAPHDDSGAKDVAVVSAEMAKAATNLWASLTPEQQKELGFAFDDDAERHNFHFIPRPRKGLPWKKMSPAQRHLASALLATGLSQRGLADVLSVMSLEDVLKDLEGGKVITRDPELYYFSVFGKPGSDSTWGWRVEGHHLSFNFTIAGGHGVASSPAFLGSNPAEVREGPRKGMRTLRDEEEQGFALAHSLDETQKKAAIFSATAPKEIITANNRLADVGKPAGIAWPDLKPEQQSKLRALVELYAHRLRNELAQHDLAEIDQAGWSNLRFAWAGGTEDGVGHYYRIHGPTFLVEFDNTQNNVNHIHTVWRDFKNDFGEDLLKQHYAAEHKTEGGGRDGQRNKGE